MLLNPHRFGPPLVTGPWRYFRLTATKWVSGNSDPNTTPKPGTMRIGEWELYIAAGTKYPTSSMTTDTAPSPLVATSSSVLSAGFEAYKAFDGVLGNSNRMITDVTTGVDAWVQIDLGSGNAIDAAYFKIAPDDNVSSPSFNYIIDFHIDGSNAGTFSGEEDRLLTRTGINWYDWLATPLTQFNRP